MTHQHQSALRGLISELLDGHEHLEPGEAQRRLFVNAPLVRVKSPVGAGDSFMAGLVLAMARQQTTAEALRLAAAASAAAVMTDATHLCRPADVLSLLPQVEVSEI